MASTNMQALEAALAKIDQALGCKREITAPKAHARHQAYLADIARIGRQDAEAVETAPGYSAKLGAFVCPKDAVAFLNGQLAADRAASALKVAAE